MGRQTGGYDESDSRFSHAQGPIGGENVCTSVVTPTYLETNTKNMNYNT